MRVLCLLAVRKLFASFAWFAVSRIRFRLCVLPPSSDFGATSAAKEGGDYTKIHTDSAGLNL